MDERKETILQAWPYIKDDLKRFMTDPYTWVTEQLEEITQSIMGDTTVSHAKDKTGIDNLTQIMRMLEDINNPS